MKRILTLRLQNRSYCVYVILFLVMVFMMAIAFVLTLPIAQADEPDLILFDKNKVKAVLIIRDQKDLTDSEYKYITDSAKLIR